MPENSNNAAPRRVLTLFDCVCIIVGTIIGSGIFKTAPIVAGSAGSLQWMVGLWVFGGVLSLIGALCFVELTSTHKDVVGGDYVYLKRAYGRPLSFMFAWAAFWIIRPGNIGAMAMTFATYFNQILPWSKQGEVFYAIGAVLLLSIANLAGLRSGKLVQNVLTSAKVLGIVGIILIAFLFRAPDAGSMVTETVATPAMGAVWFAMVMVMFTYGGWNDIALVAGEVREPNKNLFRSLVLGTLAVTAIYVVVNLAFAYGIGFEAMSSSDAVATDTVRNCLGADSEFGKRSGQLIAAVVCIACLGAINGMILTSPRIYYAAGKDFKPLTAISKWSEDRDVPWQATMLQATITIVLMSVCLLYSNAFEVIMVVTAPYFWSFLGLTALSLIILRFKDGTAASGYRVPLYPLPPIILMLVCAGLVYASIEYLISQQYFAAAIVVGVVMLVGVGLGLAWNRSKYLHETE